MRERKRIWSWVGKEMRRYWGKYEDGKEYDQNILYEKIVIKMYKTATDSSRE